MYVEEGWGEHGSLGEVIAEEDVGAERIDQANSEATESLLCASTWDGWPPEDAACESMTAAYEKGNHDSSI